MAGTANTRIKRGIRVKHVTKGWVGWVYGAGPGRKESRWLNPEVVYVDWFHRKPATGKHSPGEVVPC